MSLLHVIFMKQSLSQFLSQTPKVAFGDDGLTYKYSNNVVPALSWTPLLRKIKDDVEAASGYNFNFVLINRYAGYPLVSSLERSRSRLRMHIQMLIKKVLTLLIHS